MLKNNLDWLIPISCRDTLRNWGFCGSKRVIQPLLDAALTEAFLGPRLGPLFEMGKEFIDSTCENRVKQPE